MPEAIGFREFAGMPDRCEWCGRELTDDDHVIVCGPCYAERPQDADDLADIRFSEYLKGEA